MKAAFLRYCVGFFTVLWLLSCNGSNNIQPPDVAELSLKRGNIIACGPPEKMLGTVDFPTSCSPATKEDFTLGMALLHSFEYDEAEKAFAKVIDGDPGCAMAYWGVAMSNYHQVWPTTPSEAELEKGSKAIAVAQSMPRKSAAETGYINATAVFYKDWKSVDHRTRSLRFRDALKELHAANPADKEAAVLYALSLVATADPTDKTFAAQKQAGTILNGLYPGQPGHPGIVHYIIHAYDSPELAALALPAARRYAAIAPSSAHAQHMPSHIFTRLGLWDEDIKSNLVAAASAKCYAEGAGLKGHWDEELHAVDYLVYAYLQKGDNASAKQWVDYLQGMQTVEPLNFKVAYAFAASPSRYLLENRMWKEAAAMKAYPANFPWQKFPWQKAIIHFTRLMGAANEGNTAAAKAEAVVLKALHDTLLAQKDAYKAGQVAIQLKTGEAWIALSEGRTAEAVALMRTAAGAEDKTEKAPVTPGEVLPAKELLGDMLLRLNRPAEALAAYEENLQKHLARFNGLYGAALASERLTDDAKARRYYKLLLSVADSSAVSRPELEKAKAFREKDRVVYNR